MCFMDKDFLVWVNECRHEEWLLISLSGSLTIKFLTALELPTWMYFWRVLACSGQTNLLCVICAIYFWSQIFF